MRPLTRTDKETRYRQQARVIWLFGLSGAGKTTLAAALEWHLEEAGYVIARLDGDQVRAGLNAGLGFSDADRTENLRRVAEVARLYVHAGLVTICSFITPRQAQRDLVRSIIGAADYLDIYVEASFSTCAQRDTKGLYARASANRLTQFTGKDSTFEPPAPGACSFVLNTETESADASAIRLRDFVIPYLQLST